MILVRHCQEFAAEFKRGAEHEVFLWGAQRTRFFESLALYAPHTHMHTCTHCPGHTHMGGLGCWSMPVHTTLFQTTASKSPLWNRQHSARIHPHFQLSVFLEKIPVFYLAGHIFHLTDTLLLWSIHLFNQPFPLPCWNFNVFLSRAWLKSPNILQHAHTYPWYPRKHQIKRRKASVVETCEFHLHFQQSRLPLFLHSNLKPLLNVVWQTETTFLGKEMDKSLRTMKTSSLGLNYNKVLKLPN